MPTPPALRVSLALALVSVVGLIFLFSTGSLGADRAEAKAPVVDARSWVLVDASDGEVLTGSRRNLRLPMASTTKLMTAYLAMRRLPLERRVIAPAYPADPVESLMGLKAGQRVSVRDLLYGLILLSGNDAAVALANAVSGSTEAFVGLMNRTAMRLGLRNTSFTNPIGLDSPDHYSSASDLAKLARLLRRIPYFRKISASREADLTSYRPPRRIVTVNDFLFEGPWATGVKTGRTLGAGYVLVSSATRGGASLIGTVIGAPTEESRDAETVRLMKYGFSLFSRRPVTARGEAIASVPLRYGGGELDLVAARESAVALRKGQVLRTVVRVGTDEAEGPLRRGTQLGSLLVEVDGQRRAPVPLLAAKGIPAPSIIDRLQDFFGGDRLYLAILAGLIIFISGVALVFRIRSKRVRNSVKEIGRRTR